MTFLHFLLSLLLLVNALFSLQQCTEALPLMTNSRWIIDENGNRVKLACVNWASHLETMLAEGMHKQPMDTISKKIVSMNFNCVRLTWPLYLVTNDSLASLSVRQSFQALGLVESLAAIQVNNPAIIDLTLIKAFEAVVSNLAENKLMVVLDNHVSKPIWCCSKNDGNGFFGEKYFDPELWIEGLAKMATIFNGSSYVVGMSLRNELRGPRQNIFDWYRYMQRGAEAVHAANPDILVILSGLDFDKDLSYLWLKQVQLTFTGKLVFEVHLYAFTNGQDWADKNANEVCGRIVSKKFSDLRRKAAFLINHGWPLFLSEFGFDQSGTNINDNRFLACILGFIAEVDLDWAIWSLGGDYYIREGGIGREEFYGVLDRDWRDIRNTTMLQRIQTLQPPFQGPGLSDLQPHSVLFHPLTGLCILKKSLLEPAILGPCEQSEAWSYTNQHALVLKDTPLCLKADGIGKPAKFSISCNDYQSKWDEMSESRMHLSSKMSLFVNVCLDVDPVNKNIITNPCKCLRGDHTCDPMSQWFKIVETTRPIISKNPTILQLFFKTETWAFLMSQFLDILR